MLVLSPFGGVTRTAILVGLGAVFVVVAAGWLVDRCRKTTSCAD